jgi:hypothetical protein
MKKNEGSRSIASLLLAIALVAIVFFAPIITFTAFTQREQNVTLYDAVFDDEHTPAARGALLIATVMIVAAFGIFAARGSGFLDERFARIAGLVLIVSIIPLVAFHVASSDRAISLLGFSITEVSIAFGAFLPAIIGVLSFFSRFVDERIRI